MIPPVPVPPSTTLNQNPNPMWTLAPRVTPPPLVLQNLKIKNPVAAVPPPMSMTTEAAAYATESAVPFWSRISLPDTNHSCPQSLFDMTSDAAEQLWDHNGPRDILGYWLADGPGIENWLNTLNQNTTLPEDETVFPLDCRTLGGNFCNWTGSCQSLYPAASFWIRLAAITLNNFLWEIYSRSTPTNIKGILSIGSIVDDFVPVPENTHNARIMADVSGATWLFGAILSASSFIARADYYGGALFNAFGAIFSIAAANVDDTVSSYDVKDLTDQLSTTFEQIFTNVSLAISSLNSAIFGGPTEVPVSLPDFVKSLTGEVVGNEPAYLPILSVFDGGRFLNTSYPTPIEIDRLWDDAATKIEQALISALFNGMGWYLLKFEYIKDADTCYSDELDGHWIDKGCYVIGSFSADVVGGWVQHSSNSTFYIMNSKYDLTPAAFIRNVVDCDNGVIDPVPLSVVDGSPYPRCYFSLPYLRTNNSDTKLCNAEPTGVLQRLLGDDGCKT